MSWSAGKDLPADMLSAIAVEIWGGAIEFNPETGLLRPANRAPAISGGSIRPEPFKRVPLEFVIGAPRVANGRAMPVLPRQPKPGWE